MQAFVYNVCVSSAHLLLMMPAAILQLIIAFKVVLVLQEIFTECIVIELSVKIGSDVICMKE